MKSIIKSTMDKIKKIIKYNFFLINGKKPWSYGYDVYKEKEIDQIINQEKFNCVSLENNYGHRIDERVIEYPWLILELPKHSGNLLDAGSSLNHNFLLYRDKLKSKKIFISTLAPEINCFWYQGVSYTYEDLRDTCYRDNFFDWVACISTIEHIGLDNTMLYTSDESKKENNSSSYLSAIKEYYRVLKPDGTLFLTFPFGKHENHGWFQVFDDKMVDLVINTFSPKLVTEFYFQYKKNGWQVSSREQSKNATCFDIHKQKTYDSDFAAFSRAVVCLRLVK
jgi:Methyltransferase domain